MTDRGREEREHLVDLLQAYADEAGRLGHVFAAGQGLHRTDAAALLAVLRAERDGDPLTPGRLGEEVGLSSGATTAAVDRLERLGHLHRRRDDIDRRRVTLHHDPAGADVGRAFFGPLAARLDAVLTGYTPAELDVVHRFLTEVVASVAEHRAEVSQGGPS
ncbi:MarR family winged helix-turn-helix transcriptional regulator [Actinomycetospora straminea]|uniref:MarR family transcriptional regulator n=1 Tax=Actinomycetospora straminea TaxID=663607 RepID=A0ABP9DWP1_9PSEU|nr:MarR family winged helix-turn-helix transcriptional regulator [Actinomycetospora straminea]MDD7932317.1 MarR family winged helix-turn-helix transcriptional regulator [Actinomycetospora straminea]